MWTYSQGTGVLTDPNGQKVATGYSGKGIGKAVCIEGLIYLKNKGLTTAILYVDEDNEAGKGLYKSLGFN